jgi:hypothetical protein
MTGGGDVDVGALVEHVLVQRAEDPEERICLTALEWLHVLIRLSCFEVRHLYHHPQPRLLHMKIMFRS